MIPAKTYQQSLKIIKEFFASRGIGWILVSGAAVHLYNNPGRPLTDIDVIVDYPNISALEDLLSSIAEVDGLSHARFFSKFGVVYPLTTYLRMFVGGVEVHASTEWICKTQSGQLIQIPFDKESFRSAVLVTVNGFEVKVARPELIFLCKCVTRRTVKQGRILINKDLNDCESLVKNYRDIDIRYLKELFVKIDQTALFDQVATPLLKKYNLP